MVFERKRRGHRALFFRSMSDPHYCILYIKKRRNSPVVSVRASTRQSMVERSCCFHKELRGYLRLSIMGEKVLSRAVETCGSGRRWGCGCGTVMGLVIPIFCQERDRIL